VSFFTLHIKLYSKTGQKSSRLTKAAG